MVKIISYIDVPEVGSDDARNIADGLGPLGGAQTCYGRRIEPSRTKIGDRVLEI